LLTNRAHEYLRPKPEPTYPHFTAYAFDDDATYTVHADCELAALKQAPVPILRIGKASARGPFMDAKRLPFSALELAEASAAHSAPRSFQYRLGLVAMQEQRAHVKNNAGR